MQVIRNICSATNRPIDKLQRIFAPYVVDLNAFQSNNALSSTVYKDLESQNLDQSRYVFNQILSADPNARQVYS